MAGVRFALCSLFLLFIHTLCLDVNRIQVPTDNGISGVFLIQTKDNKYSFNATAAKEACDAINMRIATKAEVETANKNGFQTCRYGWVEEPIAVIPRTEKSEKCGQNKLGVIVWRADISKTFDVYCFKPTGPGEQTTTSRGPEPTTEAAKTPSTSYSSTPSTHPSFFQSSSSSVRTLPLFSSTPSVSSAFTTSSTTFILTSLTSAGSQATTVPQPRSSRRTITIFSTSPSLASSHSSDVLLRTSSSAGLLSPSQTARPNRPSMRAGNKTLAIVSVTLLLLLGAAGTAWYLKIKRGQQFPSWTRMRAKNITETEMWRHIRERHCVQKQTTDNNNRKCDNIILQMEEDPDPDSL